MKETAAILGFIGRELKTIGDLQAAILALRQDLRRGAVTPKEARRIQKEIDTRLKQFKKAPQQLTEVPRPLTTPFETR
jgi:hypothetical protein